MHPSCPHCLDQNANSESPAKNVGSSSLKKRHVVKIGAFARRADNTLHQRFLCRICRKTFSDATGHPCCRQKKRNLNPQVFKLLVSGISQRRLSRILKTNRKTIVRKFIFLGYYSKLLFNYDRLRYPQSTEFEFDDLETMEHSKLKPVSVTMAVETGSRRIIGFRVSEIPCRGRLAQKARKKYGPRKDQRKAKRPELFEEIQGCIAKNAIIKSDQNPHYHLDVKRFFANSQHRKYKGRRGCIVGQGELKAGGYDPLFSLNHTFAMLRANINRLFRRTWNTTKKISRLEIHLWLYALYHNLVLI